MRTKHYVVQGLTIDEVMYINNILEQKCIIQKINGKIDSIIIPKTIKGPATVRQGDVIMRRADGSVSVKTYD